MPKVKQAVKEVLRHFIRLRDQSGVICI